MTGKTLNTDTAVAADAERATDMTEKITREEIEALLKLAVAATPGPWKQHLVDDTTVICSQREICCTFAKGGLNDDLDFNSDTEQFEVDAAFIAAANPVVLKALCTLALQALAMQPRPTLHKYQSCGCVICTCENDEQCQGCGAKHCGTHPLGEIPHPIYITFLPEPRR